ncbi:sensor histidine kinase [Hydrogenoanaerobacterium sp.]|uniref:cache domain-containing sensor histidine kinase n=1 Tax=Hydrogenoanaerobacterium sp. TaxID=2953763 RepID=UPI0028A0C617|nr:sensor histidine kinase [Hydrogenoanaerobacterium sp.]
MKRLWKKWQQKTSFLLPRLKWNSLFILIAATTTVIAVIAMLLIVYVMNRRFDESIDRTLQQNNTQLVDNVATSIDSYIAEMISVSDTISKLLSDNNVNSVFQNYHFVLRDDIDTIAVFDEQGQLVMKTDQRPLKEHVDVKKQTWFRSIAPGSRIYTLTEPHVQRLYGGEYRWVISLSKGIEWEDERGKHRGVMLVDMNFNNIKELCSKELGENGYLYIVGANDKLIYHPRQQMIYAGISDSSIPIAYNLTEGNSVVPQDDGERMLVTVKKLKNTDWKIAGVCSMNGLLTFDGELRNFITLVVVCAAIVIIALSVFVSFLISNPLLRLMHLMGRVEAGELSAFSTVRSVYEVNELSTSFNQMVYKIKQLMEQVIQEQKQLRKSEMNTLHAQINPHFLYNTLDSIVWMAESGDQQSVVKMITALAQFFRLSLSGGSHTISVGDELSHAENYLVIQKMRYDDQFSYTIMADDKVKSYKTLKIMLQPIIENAVIHGVGNLPHPGIIDIRAEIKNDKLVYTVRDNGFGIKPEKLEHVLDIGCSSKSRVGIKNVHQRIQLMYGSDYGLQFKSEPDEGTEVSILLPLVEA